ncbi:MAG: P-loop NTPase fold protein [Gammaproteobacteria bacterium]|nr:P-loop NTPase fold protein [Gammaproteobacteria bacterium]
MSDMGIRIQPKEIEIPDDDPFANDLLDRRQSVEVLTRLIDSIEGPCVLAVDAAWGAGKTTFLNIWSQHLRIKGFPVVGFNAWETDYSENPFVVLSSELMEGLDLYKKRSLTTKIDKTKELTKELLKKISPYAIQAVLESVPGGTAISPALLSLVEDKLSAHQEAQNSIENFKDALQDMAKELAKHNSHSLIVVIDELDRCRPTYAVELLEVAKHLFSVDKIIFVLAINRTQLAHSIQALYGASFNGEDYLGRFFDLDFRLPEPKQEYFIDALLDQNSTGSHIHGEVETLLKVFLGAPDLSLRQIAQSIHRLGLVLVSLRDDRKPYIFTVVVLLILRTVDIKLYHQFCQGGATDLEVSVALSAMIKERSSLVDEARFYLDTTLVFSSREISDIRINWQLGDSLLYKEYKNKLDELPDTASDYSYMQRVVGYVENWHSRHGGRTGFRHSIELIELLSSDFIGAS